MTVQNTDIATMLNKVADLLEIEGENPFKVRAYRTAAQTIATWPQSLAERVAEEKKVPHLPGVGESIAGKIQEILQTGHLSLLEKLEQELPGELISLVALPGLGPKRAKQLYQQLGIQNLSDLAQAVQAQRIRQLPGFGVKTEEHLREELKRHAVSEKRIKLSEAEQTATPLCQYLKQLSGVDQVIVAGSYRRRKETVGDLDILITCPQNMPVMDQVVAYEAVAEVLAQGQTRATMRLQSGLQVDVRVVPEVSYGAALVYFTGSKAHNITLRTMAVERGLKINEYGVFREDVRIAGKTEEEVYAQLDLPYIAPELREAQGEIEAAQQGQLPRLIAVDAIRGDLHAHTQASDGRNTLEEMAEAAMARGYEYLAITDHTKRTAVARGLNEERLLAHIKAIEALNEKLDGLRLLKSAEVDILEDGSLDMPDWILKEMDIRICSVHYHFKLSRREQTERVLRAMDNPYFNVFCHPTGRLINRREPYDIDLERVMTAALERGCVLELDASPDRLDLKDIHCRMAKEMGLKVVISSDAHKAVDLANIRYGVDQARRGWLEPADVVNTRPWPALQKLLQR